MASAFGFLLPLVGVSIFLQSGVEISSLSLDWKLEQEIFKQVIASEVGFIPGTLLLGLFAYQQILHYFLWIIAIPRASGIDLRWRSSDFLINRKNIAIDLLRNYPFAQGGSPAARNFSGAQPPNPHFFFNIRASLMLVCIISGIALFYFYPVEFRKMYFAVGFFHIALELPLLFIYRLPLRH